MNLLISRGVTAHNVERLARNRFRATLRWRDLRPAMLAAGDEGCSLTVIGRGGLPAVASSLLKRPALVVSMLIAAAALIVLSGSLLVVDLSSCDPASAEKVRALLKEEGVGVGSRLSRIDCGALEEKLCAGDDTLRFAKFRLDGVIMRVRLELSENAEIQAAGSPSSIYANKDCVIRRIAAYDGRAVAEAGQAVRRGELLVSGDVTPEGGGEQVLVHSEAEIEGEVAYRFTVTVGRTALRPVSAGNAASIVRIGLFGLKADSFTGFERNACRWLHGAYLSACPFPVRVLAGEAREIVLAKTELSGDEMLDEALAEAARQLVSAVPKDARIISKQTEIVWNPDGSLTLSFEVRTIENIGYQRYL